MKLKSLLLATVASVVITVGHPGVAKADPITTFVVSTVLNLAAGTAAAAVATFVVNSALYAGASWALSKASQALGKNKQAVQERQASVLQLTVGEVPREMVFGHTVTGGSLIDAFNHGGQHGTDFVTRVIALADHAVDSLVAVWVDDQRVAFAGNGTQPGFGGTLSIEFRNATGDAVALPTVAAAGGWGAADKLIGVTHVWVTYKFDDKVWTQGHPQFRWEMRGLRLYDPRKDAALGYTGPNPHVWEDRSTHEFTQNAALARYAFTRGIYTEGRQGQPDHLLIGRGLSAEEAPPERIIAAANLCDEVVGPFEVRYIAVGVIRASDDFVQVEEWFAAAMAGVIVQHEGGVEIEPGQAKAAVVTITDADLVIGEPVSFSSFLPDTDGGRINTVVPRYIEPLQNWADHSGPVRRDLADIAEDGGPREETLALPFVPSGSQADRCAEIRRRLNRLERRATITLPPRFAYLEEGDWIAWQSARRHDGATVRYRIESWARDEAWRMRLSLREIASSVYGVPDPVEDLAEPPPTPTPLDAVFLPDAAAEAIQLEGDSGAIPAIRFSWRPLLDPAILAVRAEVRTLGQGDIAASRTEFMEAGSLIVTDGVTPEATLEARLVPIANSTRRVVATPWFTVVTPSLVVSDTERWGGRPVADLARLERQTRTALEEILRLGNDRAAGALRETLERFRQIQDTLDRLTLMAEIDPVDRTVIIEREVIIRGEGPGGTLGSTLTTLRAADTNAVALINQEATVRAAADLAETTTRTTQISAVNSSIATVQTSVSTVATNLAAETSTRTAQVSSLSGSIAAVETSVTTVATNLAAETATRTTQISAVNGAIAAVETSVTTVATNLSAETATRTTQISSLNGAIASVETSVTTVATNLSAETATRTSQVSALNTSIAGVQTSVTTVANDLSALTTSTTNQFSTVNGTLASYGTQITTNATAISAETTARTSAISAVNDSIAAVTTEVTTLATALSAETTARETLAATTGTNFAAVNTTLTALSNADTTLASSISSVQTTANGALSSAVLALSALNGNEATVILQTDVAGRLTGQRINGATGAIDFAAEFFNVTAGSGGGISYSAAAQIFKVFDGSSKTVLKASGGIRLWSGPASVADGAETAENGVLAVGPGVTGGGRFNGQTLSGPFDSGVPGSGVTDLTTSWQTLAFVERPMLNGFVQPRITAEASGNATPDESNVRAWTVDWRLVSTAPDGSDVEVLMSVTTGGQHFGSITFVDASWSNWDPATSTRSGQRRIALQARQGASPTTFASVRNVRLRGNYFA